MKNKELFYYKDNCFVYNKLSRLIEIISKEVSQIPYILQHCGYIFKENTIDHKRYLVFQKVEEIIRLIKWINQDVLTTDKRKERLNKNQKHYIYNILFKYHLVFKDIRSIDINNNDMNNEMRLCYQKRLLNIL